jgi:hypothetical protein
MRTYHNWTIEPESWEEQRAAQRCNPCDVIITGKGKRLTISAGESDNVHVFKEGALFFVVSVNYRFPYVGLEVFETTKGERIGERVGDVFFQYDCDQEESLGRNWEDLTVNTLARRMAQYALQD